MIKYRYKLKECKENEPHQVRSIQGIILKKTIESDKDYYIVDSTIDFGHFKHLVEFESFDPQEELQDTQLKARQEAFFKKNKETTSTTEEELKKEVVKDETEVTDFEASRSDKSKEYLKIQKMKKRALIERILAYPDQDFTKSLIMKKKVDELRNMVIEIENIRVLN